MTAFYNDMLYNIWVDMLGLISLTCVGIGIAVMWIARDDVKDE
jgi:hypothetical protein